LVIEILCLEVSWDFLGEVLGSARVWMWIVGMLKYVVSVGVVISFKIDDLSGGY
jgi:hypothetical protein